MILTPDDTVKTRDGDYTQARPNVPFELGWFYARVGRRRVHILHKTGTRVHSDLEGISRIEFADLVEDKTLEIEAELKAVGLLDEEAR